MIRKNLLCILAALAMLAPPVFASAARVYPHPVLPFAEYKLPPGTDLKTATRNAVPDDTFILLAGDFPGGQFISGRNGLPGHPITLRSEVPGGAHIVGSTETRPDCLHLFQCKFWVVDGIVFERAANAGLRLGTSSNATVRNVTCWFNGFTGCLAGYSSDCSFSDSLFAFNTKNHGIYLTGPVTGCTFTNDTCVFNGIAGIQFNASSSSSFSTGHKVTNCTLDCNGQLLQGATVNCIGLRDTVFEGVSINDSKNGGFAFTSGCTGNVINSCVITMRPTQGKACVSAFGVGKTTVTNCRLWAGKAAVQAITAGELATIIESGNLIAPPMAAVTPTPTPTPEPGPIAPPT